MRSRALKIEMKGYGNYLGGGLGCFYVSDRNKKKTEYRHFAQEIDECILKDGNYISVDALRDLALFNIDTYIMTRYDRIVGFLVNPEDGSHVKTRLCQYEAYNSEKGITIAKQFVISKIEGQNLVLRKHGLRSHGFNFKEKIENIHAETLDKIRSRLHGIEGRYSERYFNQIFQLLPEPIRPESRKKFKAYDGTNNIFNLAYEMLSWKVHRAIVKAKLEPYLGFLHSLQHGKPSLVCDLQELYRYLVDDFLVQHCRRLSKKDFTTKAESVSRKRKGKREYLNNLQTKDLMKQLNALFECEVEVPRIRIGKRQTIETLINEEALLLAKFLRGERKSWTPRVTVCACAEASCINF